MKQLQYFLLIIIPLLALASNAESQYLWRLEHTDFDGKYYYAFDCVSCSGEICVAGGSFIDPMRPLVMRMFWRSIDGGKTWEMLNPGLPTYNDLQQKHYFSAIQQIDSVNVIAGGDSGYVIRTYNGGKTWIKEDLKTNAIVRDIHFSDSLSGIILAQEDYSIITGGGSVKIHTTTDGGRNWVTSSLNEFNPNSPDNLTSCHSYGNGRFRVFKSGTGPVYTTNDYWQTVDSSSLLPDHYQEDSIYYSYRFNHCSFSESDTIIAYGYYYDTANWVKSGGVIIRSFDGGDSWQTPNRYPSPIGGITKMTSIDRDTILSSSTSEGKILMSIDKGASWKVDSILLDTNYIYPIVNSLSITSSGKPISIFGNNNTASNGVPSILVQGEIQKNYINQINFLIFQPHIYPNPASNFINLSELDPLRPIHIIDIFGREVLRSQTTEAGAGIIDISLLPSGIYDVLLDRNGKLLNAGKIAIIGH